MNPNENNKVYIPPENLHLDKPILKNLALDETENAKAFLMQISNRSGFEMERLNITKTYFDTDFKRTILIDNEPWDSFCVEIPLKETGGIKELEEELINSISQKLQNIV